MTRVARLQVCACATRRVTRRTSVKPRPRRAPATPRMQRRLARNDDAGTRARGREGESPEGVGPAPPYSGLRSDRSNAEAEASKPQPCTSADTRADESARAHGSAPRGLRAPLERTAFETGSTSLSTDPLALSYARRGPRRRQHPRTAQLLSPCRRDVRSPFRRHAAVDRTVASGHRGAAATRRPRRARSRDRRTSRRHEGRASVAVRHARPCGLSGIQPPPQRPRTPSPPTSSPPPISAR